MFYGEVSDDSDGTLELVLAHSIPTSRSVDLDGDIQLRVEAEHDEAFHPPRSQRPDGRPFCPPATPSRAGQPESSAAPPAPAAGADR